MLLQVPERIKTLYASPVLRPAVLAVLVFIGAYLIWLRFFAPTPVKPGAIVPGVTSPKVADLPRKEITPKKLTVFKDKGAVTKKLKLPEAADEEEVLDAVDAPPTNHGTTTVVFVNTTTGKSRSVVVVKKAPWFAFERTNYMGLSIGAGTADGTAGRVYYKRDLAQVKGVYLQGEIQAVARPGAVTNRQLEGVGWVNLEYRR